MLDYLERSHCQVDTLTKNASSKLEELLKNPNNQKIYELINNLNHSSNVNLDFNNDVVKIGDKDEIPGTDLLENLETLGPWKKGPFNLFGEDIDAEWRSDQKWNRIKKAIPSLKNKNVLDIGCNNGYFMFRMLSQDPKLVLGIDPVMRVYAQFNFLNHYAKQDKLKMELLGVDDVALFNEYFDVIFSMGIIYHHRNPIEQLLDIRKSLKPGGTLILETIGIPGEDDTCLFPSDRYAKMRNVWFVPTLSTFLNWVKRSKFKKVEVISSTPLTNEEQRVTKWSGPVSLDDFLDPNNKELTVEGYPAPMRFCIKCKKAD